MSLYKDYAKEIDNKEVVEYDNYFYSYVILPKDRDKLLYVKELYIKPEYRHTGLAFKVGAEIEELAKCLGCKYLLGSVAPTVEASNRNLKMYFNWGFKLFNSDNQLIYIIKDLQERI